MGSTSGTPFSIIIVGAGISGISAAKTLHDGGIRDFIILEATSRIGGRIQRAEFGGEIIELGANWLHGGGKEAPSSSSTPVQEAAQKTNLKSVFSNYTNVSSYVYRQEGGLYDEEEVKAAMKEAEAVLDLGSNLSQSMQDDKEEDMSILALQRLCKRVPRSPLERMVDYYYYNYEDGEPPKVTSLKHTLPRNEFKDFGDYQLFVTDPRGFEIIVHHFAKQFLMYKNDVVDDDRVKLNKVVKEIIHTDNGVTLKTEDGFVYHSEAIIISVSLGVLQSDLIQFNPSLPEWKHRAICEFNMITFTKIFLKFPYVFWPTGPGTEFFFYVHERRGYYPIWKHFENEKPGSNILLVMTCDEESTRIEQQPDEKTKAEIVDVLHKMFGNEIPEPEDMLVPRWKADKFYQGSYSNWPVGFTQRRHEQLCAPVGPIYFTGEHTNSDHFGCVEGAYIAGQNTAKKVIKYLHKVSQVFR